MPFSGGGLLRDRVGVLGWLPPMAFVARRLCLLSVVHRRAFLFPL